MSLDKIRKNYTKGTLLASQVDANPITQFQQWMDAALAAGVDEPTAMTLSTVSESGRPSSRIVLLKGIENGHFLFFTNYLSHKGRELSAHPSCALNFFWPGLERQVRIEGIAHLLPESKSTAYFQSRPRASQIGAWSSPQSAVIADRSLLEARVKEVTERFKGQEVLPRPNQWGGFGVEPFLIEFWQGREDRLHDRVVYVRTDKGWDIRTLAP